jgi:hypothetical protein
MQAYASFCFAPHFPLRVFNEPLLGLVFVHSFYCVRGSGIGVSTVIFPLHRREQIFSVDPDLRLLDCAHLQYVGFPKNGAGGWNVQTVISKIPL